MQSDRMHAAFDLRIPIRARSVRLRLLWHLPATAGRWDNARSVVIPTTIPFRLTIYVAQSMDTTNMLHSNHNMHYARRHERDTFHRLIFHGHDHIVRPNVKELRLYIQL